jgi:hypothetical protein
MESCLRVVGATVAFGMSINCHDVRQVLSFGLASDIEAWLGMQVVMDSLLLLATWLGNQHPLIKNVLIPNCAWEVRIFSYVCRTLCVCVVVCVNKHFSISSKSQSIFILTRTASKTITYLQSSSQQSDLILVEMIYAFFLMVVTFFMLDYHVRN